jgi:hypothetical protein
MGAYSGWAINRSNKVNVQITICRIVALGRFAADPGNTARKIFVINLFLVEIFLLICGY